MRRAREDQARPVPEVERVGDAPDEAQGPEREQRPRAGERAGEPGGDHDGGARDRCDRRAARELGRRGVDERRDDDRREPRDARPERGEPRHAHEARRDQRDAGARGELPHARRGREVRDRGLRGGCDQRIGERCDADDGQHGPPAHARAPARAAPADPQRGEEQQRPDEVELLLDAERPVVQHRVLRCAERQVVDRLERELPVRVIERRRDRVEAHLRAEDGRREEQHAGRDRDEHEQRDGQQAPRATGIERGECDRARALHLVDQQAGDQEPRDDVEDVDAHIAARDPRDPGVERQHEHDGDGAQALDVGPERPGGPDGRRSRGRHGASGPRWRSSTRPRSSTNA